MNDADHVWRAVAQILREEVTDAVWHSCFQDAAATAIGDGELVLAVPSSHIRDRIESRYVQILRDALVEIGRPELSVRIVVRSQPAQPEIITIEQLPLAPATNGQGAAPDAAQRRSGPGLNGSYTFETFVTGAGNRFAHAAALRVAETPAKSYNPLFIYGAAGLGKTHLLHAIGHYVIANYDHYAVRYVSTETFLNEYIESIRTDTTAQLRRRYREIDVLLIDDIQFMESKEGLQEEFFHTFNSLHGANRQIVISSDRSPDSIALLEDRLRGRFKWGLITDIQPPDLETRVAILRNKARRDSTPVPDDVLEYIATHITSNIRELEGALIRVSAFSSLHRAPMTVPMAEQLLADLLTDAAPKSITPQLILDHTAQMFGFSIDALRGKSRHRPLVTARQIAMYVFRELTDLSYPAIAREFGGRDHTTVIHAVDKIQKLMKERHAIYDQVSELLTRVKSGT